MLPEELDRSGQLMCPTELNRLLLETLLDFESFRFRRDDEAWHASTVEVTLQGNGDSNRMYQYVTAIFNAKVRFQKSPIYTEIHAPLKQL